MFPSPLFWTCLPSQRIPALTLSPFRPSPLCLGVCVLVPFLTSLLKVASDVLGAGSKWIVDSDLSDRPIKAVLLVHENTVKAVWMKDAADGRLMFELLLVILVPMD